MFIGDLSGKQCVFFTPMVDIAEMLSVVRVVQRRWIGDVRECVAIVGNTCVNSVESSTNGVVVMKVGFPYVLGLHG